MVWIDADIILLKEVWMLRDERDDIIHLLLRWLKTTFTIRGNDEFVASDASAIAV